MHLDVVVTQLHAQLVKPLTSHTQVRVADRLTLSEASEPSTASSLASRGLTWASSKMSSSSDEHCWDESVLPLVVLKEDLLDLLSSDGFLVAEQHRPARVEINVEAHGGLAVEVASPLCQTLLQQALQPGLVSKLSGRPVGVQQGRSKMTARFL